MSQVGKDFLHIIDELILLPSLDDNVIYASLNIMADLGLGAILHPPLVGGIYILQSKLHLIKVIHRDLVVA